MKDVARVRGTAALAGPLQPYRAQRACGALPAGLFGSRPARG